MTPWPHPFREAPSHRALRCRDSCADRLKTASCPFAISAADGDDRQKSPSEQPRLLHEREVPAGVSLEDSGLASEPPRTREENENPNDEVPPIVSRKKSPGSSPLVAADVGGPRVGGPQPVRSKKLTEPNLYACTAQTHNHHCASPTLFQEREIRKQRRQHTTTTSADYHVLYQQTNKIILARSEPTAESCPLFTLSPRVGPGNRRFQPFFLSSDHPLITYYFRSPLAHNFENRNFDSHYY